MSLLLIDVQTFHDGNCGRCIAVFASLGIENPNSAI
jgi:hypothetical protein